MYKRLPWSCLNSDNIIIISTYQIGDYTEYSHISPFLANPTGYLYAIELYI